MIYQKGQYVYFKKYLGRIQYVLDYNKTYIVQLYGYKGMQSVDRQCEQHELYSYEQISLT